MATIKDIAKAAGVSHGTVSNVLNRRGGVSYEKIRLVEEAAIAMGYAIDEQASSLRRGKTRTIAVLLPSLNERRYTDLYTGIVKYANNRGYDVSLFFTEDLPHEELKALKSVASLRACGVLAVSSLATGSRGYADLSVPLLFLERAAETEDLPAYTFDMKDAARLAFGMCREAEHVCVLSGNPGFSDQSSFIAQLPLSASSFFSEALAGPGQAISGIVNQNDAPDVVICTSEELADRLLYHWRESKGEQPLRILALASLRTFTPQDYGHVDLNYRAMGHEAATALIASVEGKGRLTSRIFAPHFISRTALSIRPERPRPLRILAHTTPATLALEQLSPRFSRQTGIAVEVNHCSLDELHKRLANADVGGWDVLRIDPSALPYVAPRVLMPIEDIDPKTDENSKRFVPGLSTDFSRVNGILYALPFDISVQMLFYQRTLLESAAQKRAFLEAHRKNLHVPETFAEFDKLCQFFSRAYRAESPSAFGTFFPPSNPTSIASDFLPRLLSAGGLVYDDKGRLDLSTPIALNTVREYVAYISCTNRRHTQSWSDIALDFAKGEVAMAIIYAHHASNFVISQRGNAGVDVGFASVPGGRPLLAGGSLGILKHSDRPEDAYAFIQWATGEDIAPELVMRGGTSACDIVYHHREILDTYPWLEALPANLSKGIRKPILSVSGVDYNQRDFEYALGKQLFQAICGYIPPEEALKNAQQVLDGIT
ncbi:MAG: extracellular solute-binding protein [Clostridiales bacterium]|nr:extracellular solute-binding protein [Clostridiales bacterium]